MDAIHPGDTDADRAALFATGVAADPPDDLHNSGESMVEELYLGES